MNSPDPLALRIDTFRQAAALNPNSAAAHNNLGAALGLARRFDEAIAAFHRAIALNPGLAAAYNNLGEVLVVTGPVEEAIAAFRNVVALTDSPESHSALGAALIAAGKSDEAIAAYRRAIALDPQFPKAHTNLAMALLLRGEFLRGWDEYEWRWNWKNFQSEAQRFTQPRWQGQPLSGQTVLLHAEQGFGDTLQFIRYFPLVAQRCPNLIVQCPAPLHRILRSIVGNAPMIAADQPLPAYDLYCPLMSLPRIFQTTLDSIPRQIPYLHADPSGIAAWKARLSPLETSLKIGLAWAGSPVYIGDYNRSIPLPRLEPLSRATEARFISLQTQDVGAQANEVPSLNLLDVSAHLKDFADTAALIANLDLVIAVDTAVAHLAGALGKPVWLLLRFAPDWRWMLDRSDSPWYPTLRLFRQPTPGDWNSVIANVAQALIQHRQNPIHSLP